MIEARDCTARARALERRALSTLPAAATTTTTTLDQRNRPGATSSSTSSSLTAISKRFKGSPSLLYARRLGFSSFRVRSRVCVRLYIYIHTHNVKGVLHSFFFSNLSLSSLNKRKTQKIKNINNVAVPLIHRFPLRECTKRMLLAFRVYIESSVETMNV